MTQEEIDAQDAYRESLVEEQDRALRKTGLIFLAVTIGGAIAFAVLQFLGLGLSWWWILVPLAPLILVLFLMTVFQICFPYPGG